MRSTTRLTTSNTVELHSSGGGTFLGGPSASAIYRPTDWKPSCTVYANERTTINYGIRVRLLVPLEDQRGVHGRMLKEGRLFVRRNYVRAFDSCQKRLFDRGIKIYLVGSWS